MEAEQRVGRLQDEGSGRGIGLDRLKDSHHAAGGPNRPRPGGGDRPRDTDVAAHQGEGAKLAQGPLAEPLLGGQGVLFGLFDEAETLCELARLEAAGAGEQGPGSGQVLLDQLRFAHGLPGHGCSAGQKQGEQQHDEQTTHDGPPSTIRDRR